MSVATTAPEAARVQAWTQSSLRRRVTAPTAFVAHRRAHESFHTAASQRHHGGLSLSQRSAARPMQSRRQAVVVASGRREMLPIFPLSMVALPAADVPLQIFEARYRVLFSTLLAGAEGIDEGLVSEGKPWLGSRRFGMVYFDREQNGIASIGTVLEIKRHVNIDDGRLLIENVGRERFRILDVQQEKPVLVCQVEYLDDDDDSTEEARALAEEVGGLFRALVSLSLKLREGPTLPPEVTNPHQLDTLPPSKLSFWVTSLFANSPLQQQALLEMASTRERLKAVKELLQNTVKYLSAQAALQSAFGSGGGAEPPAGGPD